MKTLTAKEMIDDLLKRGKIEVNEHIAIQLMIAGEKEQYAEYLLKAKVEGISDEEMDKELTSNNGSNTKEWAKGEYKYQGAKWFKNKLLNDL